MSVRTGICTYDCVRFNTKVTPHPLLYDFNLSITGLHSIYCSLETGDHLFGHISQRVNLKKKKSKGGKTL